MQLRRGHKLDGESEYERMLSAVAYDMSLPLLQIKTRAESGKLGKNAAVELALLTQSGLKLIDGYLMALEMRSNAAQLPLEPVPIGSVLAETASELSQYAKHYKTRLVIDILGRPKPVLTNKTKLQSALYCLAASLIRSQAGSATKQNVIVLAAHKNNKDSMTAGVYGLFDGLSDKELYNARRLAGKAPQPLSSLPAQNGGGILIADMLLTALYQPLKAGKFKEMSGFAAQLPLSKQLRLV